MRNPSTKQKIHSDSELYHFRLSSCNVMSAFVFFFDLCRPILGNANVKCKHHHLLPQTLFLMIVFFSFGAILLSFLKQK